MTHPKPDSAVEAARRLAIETVYADGHDEALKGKALATWAVGAGFDHGYSAALSSEAVVGLVEACKYMCTAHNAQQVSRGIKQCGEALARFEKSRGGGHD